MASIQLLHAREILDSRGNPTLEVTCELSGGFVGTAGVPSGASTGVHEALELRDKDEARYNGLGVLQAIGHIEHEIQKAVSGKEFTQQTLDEALIALDGTEHKTRLGANAILGVSLAFAHASAREAGKELFEHIGSLTGNTQFLLPEPFFNIINGGKHADSGLDIQEYLIGPVGLSSVHEKVRAGEEVISALKKILLERGLAVSVGDEGGFAPKLASNEEALLLIEEAIRNAGYTLDQIKIGIDVAASSFYTNGFYNVKIKGEQRQVDSRGLIDWYAELVTKHPIISIEDGLSEDDFDGFALVNQELGGRISIVGDDLTVTNKQRIQMAFEKKAINAVIIKPNQIGTLSETIEAILLTKQYGWIPFVSHRSGETMDTTIADLSVGLSCGRIKSGSLTRGERVAKYNRLMEIEDILASK